VKVPSVASRRRDQGLLAVPADLERRRVFLAAFGTAHRGTGRGLEVFVDESASALGIRGIVDPDLGKGCLDRQLAGEARGVRVEDARANAPFGELIDEELRLGQVGGGVDALQNR
jgi:hypothetical protein